jgi:hypothetical protein
MADIEPAARIHALGGSSLSRQSFVAIGDIADDIIKIVKRDAAE